MNLSHPFQMPNPQPPPSRDPTSVRQAGGGKSKCAMLLPIPAEAPPWEKAKVCGKRATVKVRLGDGISSAEVDACSRCKARHDSEAAARRQAGRRKAG